MRLQVECHFTVESDAAMAVRLRKDRASARASAGDVGRLTARVLPGEPATKNANRSCRLHVKPGVFSCSPLRCWRR